MQWSGSRIELQTEINTFNYRCNRSRVYVKVRPKGRRDLNILKKKPQKETSQIVGHDSNVIMVTPNPTIE